MSTSSLPASAKPLPVRAPAFKPPVLASDILREEVAPRAPARRAVRLALLAFASTFFAGAAAEALGRIQLDAPLALAGAVGTALVATFAAIMPLPYSARAVLAAAAGATPLVLGVQHLGPLAALGEGGLGRATAMAAMSTLLPAALIFRARYRAYRGARTLLAAALLLSVPAIVLLALAFFGGGELAPRVLAAVGVLAGAAATLGFMGPETSAGCAEWAGLVVGVQAALPAWRALQAAWAGEDAAMAAWTAAALGQLLAS
ncbi:MAG TPA: hypothetical protein VGI39_23285, partial [Polyangiaceae bacterium]